MWVTRVVTSETRRVTGPHFEVELGKVSRFRFTDYCRSLPTVDGSEEITCLGVPQRQKLTHTGTGNILLAEDLRKVC